ncbi:hypothetical protein MB09_14980 [Aequorivita vladivostokensis]|uniref:Uncharacterized protein n=1 Tax=Aequorivita vladivostokensis TaxID=171194 RepID=A0ABR5DEW5_9FLAO|nr:hypothetical protein MB09_14980 [Aequorivita vladivostokensis]
MCKQIFIIFVLLTYICDSSKSKILEAFALNLGQKTGNFMQRDDKQIAHDPGVGSLIVARYTSTSGQ